MFRKFSKRKVDPQIPEIVSNFLKKNHAAAISNKTFSYCSVLGPLLFLIYINDICNIDADCNVKLYADDTNVFVYDRCLGYVFCKANTVVWQLNNWFVANKLSVSIDKTCYTIFQCIPDEICINHVKVASVMDICFFFCQPVC